MVSTILFCGSGFLLGLLVGIWLYKRKNRPKDKARLPVIVLTSEAAVPPVVNLALGDEAEVVLKVNVKYHLGIRPT